MKYVRFKHFGFVLFENIQTHANVAAMVNDEVVSAGTVTATDWCENGQVVCSGRSMGLDVGSKAEDSDNLRLRLAHP